MRTLTLITAALAFALVLGGCTYGILYTRTVEPLTLNHLTTPVAGAEGVNDIKHIQLPYVGITWGDISFGAVAKEKGLQELYYADLESLNVLSIWRQYTVHLYGR
ncbi:MAG: hypothetical protein HGB21_10840 [Nitrospirae bacterium]|nr:hypothetical protein [Nitrospirota bacterium]NTW66783.1 hypothetical protein [Nitrospirota bacterium]